MYDVGTFISLSHLNRKVASTFQKTAEANLYEVGTSFSFTGTLKAAKKIPVIAI